DELARGRQAADFCLGSPGCDKTLILRAPDLAAAFEALEGVALYALLQARRRDRTLRILVEGGRAALTREHLDFLRDHKIFLAGKDYAIVPLDRRDARSLGERVAAAARRGFNRVKLELPGEPGLWSDEELDALARGFADLERYLAGAAPRRAAPALLNLAWGRETGLGQGGLDPRASQEFQRALERLAMRLRRLGARRPAWTAYARELSALSGLHSGFLCR
ncbi:MAG: hypothetical protein PHF00_12135, partial [Elusimicrobia bacterium]|nr:hypothetical protein [Elusimicrobiota bacterium]